MKPQRISSFAELAEHVRGLNLPPVATVTGRITHAEPHAEEVERAPAAFMRDQLTTLVRGLDADHVVELRQLKQRRTPDRPVKLVFDPDTMTIRDAP